MWRKYPSKSALLPRDCDGRHSVGIGNTGTIEQFYVGGRTMITVPELSAEALGSFLTSHLGRRFSSTEAELTELVPSVARLALECIGNSDALYHNVEHTMLVTLVGYDIMKGRALLTPTTPSDYSHLLVACMYHDIGYVRGILKGDGADGYVIDARGNKTEIPRGSSDASLLHYHVDLSLIHISEPTRLLSISYAV